MTEKSQIYELGYHLVANIAESGTDQFASKIKAIVLGKDGKIIAEEAPALRNLAYEISTTVNAKKQKFDKALFGWMKFETDSSAASEIKKELGNFGEILRFILVKTVREDTIFHPKFQRPRREDGETDLAVELPAEVKEVSEEEIDKSIEQLVIA